MTAYDMFEVEQNLERAWDETTHVQRYRGAMWYPMAHDFASIIGNGNVTMGAGYLAALSANKGWDSNRLLAVNASLGIFEGHFQDALNKARLISAGVDPTLVLPMGKKTGHFYLNILDPNDPWPVTLDRHAIRVATWEWDNGNPRLTAAQYAPFAGAFRNVAFRKGVLPCVLQAGLWIYARERVGRG